MWFVFSVSSSKWNNNHATDLFSSIPFLLLLLLLFCPIFYEMGYSVKKTCNGTAPTMVK